MAIVITVKVFPTVAPTYTDALPRPRSYLQCVCLVVAAEQVESCTGRHRAVVVATDAHVMSPHIPQRREDTHHLGTTGVIYI